MSKAYKKLPTEPSGASPEECEFRRRFLDERIRFYQNFIVAKNSFVTFLVIEK